MAKETIVIGGASGFWGDAALATPQLLQATQIDYIVYDYLAEITMSIMARARTADASKGYATDFVSAAMAPNLETIAERGVKVITNAGGVNPDACAEALRYVISGQGLDLRVAVVKGDDLLPRRAEFADTTEMFSGLPFPDSESVASINAYLGAFPIADALNRGADIVITGRCVDSAVALGACIHAFGWAADEFDKLAQGSLAGHILECGTQATGGNFTDWESVMHDLDRAGYPLAEVAQDGSFEVFKPDNTGGLVSVGTVAEQMLYEIGDPQAYILPDVICDFSTVSLDRVQENRVRVSGARGHGAPDSYKVSVTWADGFRAGHVWTMYGRDAEGKARQFARFVFDRAGETLERLGLPPLTETSVEVIGSEEHFGAAKQVSGVREVDVKIAVKHPSAAGIGTFLKEMTGLALTAPPGLTGFAGARAKPTPVVRLFSFLLPKTAVDVSVTLDDECITIEPAPATTAELVPVISPPEWDGDESTVPVPLEALAFARSGDKGDKANIGVIARRPEFLPYIAAALPAARVEAYFSHFLSPFGSVERFYLPGTAALNFLLHDVLGGGGVASLRADPQGKGYAQLLLAEDVPLPVALAEKYQLIERPGGAP
ncbi:MAG: acyclic terpene utilization AtuA family protein [Pseudomonadota bacterium]